MVNIKPLHNDNRNCYEDVAVTVCGWWKRRHELMYRESWNFDYDAFDRIPPVGLGKLLKPNNPNEFVFFCKHSGIGLAAHHNSNPEEVLEVVKNTLAHNQCIAITNMDIFWIPWDTNYQISHASHAFLVVGFDESNSSLICTDPYFGKQNEPLPVDHFICGYGGGYDVFSLVEEENLQISWSEVVESAALKLLSRDPIGNAFDKMRIFAEHIELYFSPSEEMRGHSGFLTMPLYTNVQSIARGRKQFAELLQYFIGTYGIDELHPYCEILKQVGIKWDALKVLFAKVFVSSNVEAIKEKVPAKIREIADLEEKIANELLILSKKYSK